MTEREASEKIAGLLAEARTKLDAAIEVADAAGVGFSVGGLGLGYGMGGWYEPNPKKSTGWSDSGCEWDNSDCSDDSYGWKASSQGC